MPIDGVLNPHYALLHIIICKQSSEGCEGSAERALTFENIHKLRIRSVDCHKLPPLSLLLFAACATTHDNKSCNRLHTHAHTHTGTPQGSQGQQRPVHDLQSCSSCTLSTPCHKSDELCPRMFSLRVCVLIIGGKSSHSHGVYQATALPIVNLLERTFLKRHPETCRRQR